MLRHTFALCLSALLLPPAFAQDEPAAAITVPAGKSWVQTGFRVEKGQPLRVEASGEASMAGMRVWEWLTGRPVDRRVGPEGTYAWPLHYMEEVDRRRLVFPLPSATQGPWPPFSLIGRIGRSGEIFYIGRRFDGKAPATGELWLGINDVDFRNNFGEFRAHLYRAPSTEPAPEKRPIVDPARLQGRPVWNARVLVLYVDGLRPDVLNELAGNGFLPNFKRVFIDGGMEFPYAFTVFPSNTLHSNGALMTGYFSDRTGIKSQNQFERVGLKPSGLPNELLSDWWVEHFGDKTEAIDLLDKYAPQQTYGFLRHYKVETIASRLGKEFSYTSLPIIPRNPPTRWMHRAMNTIGPLGINLRLPKRMDAVNTQFAIDEMIGDPDARVLFVWMPMVDKTSHYSARGQFGAARRDLVLADRNFGQILKRLEQVGWRENTYLMLISDHGHIGGEERASIPGNLASEWAHRKLGVNVEVIGHQWRHPGLNPDKFFFFDHQGWGQAKIFMPYGDFLNGKWRPNRLHELQNYVIRPGSQPVDLIRSLHEYRASQRGYMRSPIDLVMVKIDPHRVLVSRGLENQAIIERRNGEGATEYAYRPVKNLTMDADGTLHYEAAEARTDPLGYLREPAFLEHAKDLGWIEEFHSGQEWLEATCRSEYPDAITAISKFFSWKGRLRELEPVRDPDILVTAARGWSFREDGRQGTDHGFPIFESMRISLFVHGPNVPPGVNHSPSRIVDVVPTALEMAGRIPANPDFDGKPLEGIYE